MRQSTFKHLLIIFCVSIFSSNVFAQGPPEPGNDPLLQEVSFNETVSSTTNNSEDKTDISVVPLFKKAHKTTVNITFHRNSKIYFSRFSKRKALLFSESKMFADFVYLNKSYIGKNRYSFYLIKE
jgi:hypothetical protein